MTRYNIVYNNNGGSQSDLKEPFYLYTTGIVNWAEFQYEDQNLIQIWNNALRNFIISKIPNNFSIILHHFDPILDLDNNLKPLPDGDKKTTILNYVQNELLANDRIHPRIIDSNFSDKGINPFEIQNIDFHHLVLDFAHIFIHEPDNSVTIKNYKEEMKSVPISLNVLRTGFIGNGFGRIFTFTDNIRIQDTGEITTYVNKLIELEIDYDPVNPSDTIEKIFVDILRRFERGIQELKGGQPYFKVKHIIDTVKPNDIDFVNSIMLRLWDNKPLEQIKEEVINYYISKNQGRILKMKPK